MEPMKILMAFQDDNYFKSLSTFFQSSGYRVERTTGVSEMIRRVRDGDLRVVLIDDQVEGVKAWTLVSLVKEINAKVQVIVITSEQSIESVKRLRGAGIFYQAMKPIDAEEIKSAVECAFKKIRREHPREGIFSFLVPRLVPA